MATNVVFAVVIDEKELIPFGIAGEVEIFAEFDISIGAEDDGSAIAPSAKAVGGEPIDPNIVGRPVIREEVGFPPVFKFGMIFVPIVSDLGIGDGGAFGATVMEKLFKLV